MPAMTEIEIPVAMRLDRATFVGDLRQFAQELSEFADRLEGKETADVRP